MHQTIFTCMLPVAPGRQQQLRQQLVGLGYTGPKPTSDPLGFSHLEMLHYASLFMYDDPEDGWCLVFENNIDGDIEEYISHFVRVAQLIDQGRLVLDIFNQCSGFEQGRIHQLASYLKKFTTLPAVGFSGCVGRTRNQILFEADLHRTVSHIVDGLGPQTSATEAALAVHTALQNDCCFARIADIPADTPKGEDLLRAIAREHIPTKAHNSVQEIRQVITNFLSALGQVWRKAGLLALLTLIPITVLLVVLTIWNWLRKEPSAAGDRWRPDPAHIKSLKEFEDHAPTNHMVSVVHAYTDASRRWAKWAAFILFNTLARYKFTQGALGAISTIHFAHWAYGNNKRRLLFMSNYDGSWESYLDDFTLKAATGLTFAWSHCKGLPPTRLMYKGGAADGPAFIDWARRSMVPTLVWYSAYPELSIRTINRNSALRQAIAKDTTHNNTGNWLELVQ